MNDNQIEEEALDNNKKIDKESKVIENEQEQEEDIKENKGVDEIKNEEENEEEQMNPLSHKILSSKPIHQENPPVNQNNVINVNESQPQFQPMGFPGYPYMPNFQPGTPSLDSYNKSGMMPNNGINNAPNMMFNPSMNQYPMMNPAMFQQFYFNQMMAMNPNFMQNFQKSMEMMNSFNGNNTNNTNMNNDMLMNMYKNTLMNPMMPTQPTPNNTQNEPHTQNQQITNNKVIKELGESTENKEKVENQIKKENEPEIITHKKDEEKKEENLQENEKENIEKKIEENNTKENENKTNLNKEESQTKNNNDEKEQDLLKKVENNRIEFDMSADDEDLEQLKQKVKPLPRKKVEEDIKKKEELLASELNKEISKKSKINQITPIDELDINKKTLKKLTKIAKKIPKDKNKLFKTKLKYQILQKVK